MGTNLKTTLNSSIFILIVLMFVGCEQKAIIDSQVHMPNNNWTYLNKVATPFMPATGKNYKIYFTLRINVEYKYSNLFILFKIKEGNGKEIVRRYTYKIAELDGQWSGSGSGNIFSYKFPLLTDISFKEEPILLSIEQNMKDNPLKGIVNAGIVVEPIN